MCSHIFIWWLMKKKSTVMIYFHAVATQTVKLACEDFVWHLMAILCTGHLPALTRSTYTLKTGAPHRQAGIYPRIWVFMSLAEYSLGSLRPLSSSVTFIIRVTLGCCNKSLIDAERWTNPINWACVGLDMQQNLRLVREGRIQPVWDMWISWY